MEITLNETQLRRLDALMKLGEHVEIIHAKVESSVGGVMEIDIIDHSTNERQTIKKYFAKHLEDDSNPLDLILNGLKVERTTR